MPDVVVRMKTIYAGPRGTARAGDRITVPSDEASQLVAAGYAEVATAPSDFETREAAPASAPLQEPSTTKPSRAKKKPEPAKDGE